MIVEEYLPVRNLADVAAIEAVPIDERLAVENTYDMFAAVAARYPDKLAIRFVPGGTADEDPVDTDYQTFFGQVTQAANLFHSLGVRPGRVVAYLLPNLPETYVTLWGGQAAGIVCAINYFLEAEHIGALLHHAKAEVLVAQGPSEFPIWEKLDRIRVLAPGIKTVLRVGAGPDDGGVLDFATELAKHPTGHLVSGRAFKPDDIAAYFHTGGTTGVPKITPLTHRNELAGTWSCLQSFGMTAADVVLCAMPLFHSGGIKVGGMFPHAIGATVVLLGPAGFRNPAVIKQFWRIAERYRGTYVPAPPTVYSGLLEVPIDADISSLNYLQVSAAPSPLELFRRFKDVVGLDLYEAYGLTEATLVTNANPRAVPPRHGAAGFRIPYVEQKVVALDADGNWVRDCAPGEIGVVAARGPTVFPGYLPPASTERLWLGDGWLNSGDMGRLDEDGYLWITGRAKDMIIRAGHNIDPETIEGPMHTHPAVAQCAAVAKPDAYAGELPVIFVKLAEGASASPEDLLAHARETIPERAAVPKQAIVLDELPLTAVGKIAKNTLRNEAARIALADALAAEPLLAGRATVTVEPDPTHGAVANVRLDAEGGENRDAMRAAAERRLAEFTVRAEIEIV